MTIQPRRINDPVGPLGVLVPGKRPFPCQRLCRGTGDIGRNPHPDSAIVAQIDHGQSGSDLDLGIVPLVKLILPQEQRALGRWQEIIALSQHARSELASKGHGQKGAGPTKWESLSLDSISQGLQMTFAAAGGPNMGTTEQAANARSHSPANDDRAHRTRILPNSAKVRRP